MSCKINESNNLRDQKIYDKIGEKQKITDKNFNFICAIYRI